MATATITGAGRSYLLGSSIAAAGDVDGDGYDDVVLGAPGVSYSTGQVYLHHGSAGGLSTTRGRMWEARESLARFLTGSRDALEAELEEIAREKGLPRGWAASFFLERRGSESAPSPAAPA